jgi:hypothetical protein
MIAERNSRPGLLLTSYAWAGITPSVEMPAAHPRCPYAVHGIDSSAMEGCPGYAPEPVLVGAERIVGAGLSCRYLRAQRAPRRRGAFISACTHPVLGAPLEPRPDQPGGTTRYSTSGALRSVFDT